jgi:AmmeMemoRadiSam system protein A
MHLTLDQEKTLLDIAWASIEHGLRQRNPLDVDPTRYESGLQLLGASFVTLRIEHDLRGCIGALDATRPLVVDVAQHAYAAAFCDPRFAPLNAEELPQLTIHISVLSPSSPVAFESEEVLARILRPGVDGLTIAYGRYRATFLPAVWHSIADPNEFIRQLKTKAGLAPTVQDYQAWRYMAIEFSSADEP